MPPFLPLLNTWEKALELGGKMLSASADLRDLTTTWLRDPEQVLTPQYHSILGTPVIWTQLFKQELHPEFFVAVSLYLSVPQSGGKPWLTPRTCVLQTVKCSGTLGTDTAVTRSWAGQHESHSPTAWFPHTRAWLSHNKSCGSHLTPVLLGSLTKTYQRPYKIIS